MGQTKLKFIRVKQKNNKFILASYNKPQPQTS